MRLLITLLFCLLLVVPAFTQEESMPAYVLFKLTPGVDPTSGTLYGVGDFSSARSVESGDTLTLQADLSVEAA